MVDRAQALADALPQGSSWPEELDLARRVVAETGDLPEWLWWEIGYRQTGHDGRPRSGEAWRALAALRPEGAPPYTYPWH